jgi:hypothetical protein
MLRRVSLLLAALLAPNTMGAIGCRSSHAPSATPSAAVSVTRLGDTHPALALVRCQTRGLAEPVHYRWTLAPSLRTLPAPPRNGPTLLVQVPETPRDAADVVCQASDDGGQSARAARSVAELVITRTERPSVKSRTLTVEGHGFGSTRQADDGLYLVPQGEAPIALDLSCAQAHWAGDRIVGCVPASAPASLDAAEVRVQSGAQLAVAPPERPRAKVMLR